MSTDRLRRRVAFEAARLIFAREEKQYSQAKRKAVRRLCTGMVAADDLPSNGEIRARLNAMTAATQAEQERILLGGPAEDMQSDALVSSQNLVDRFRVYELLLLPLEEVVEPPETHPEGDVLYHSLQVFELAREALPYDEEFLLAALLHDVGKAIDRHDHVAVGLQALDDAITPRTAWLIEHHVEAQTLRDDALGVRLRRRLERSESYDELMLLADCDRRGRTIGMQTPDLQDALDYLRELSDSCGDVAG
jgi:hypothetical protein